MPVNFQPREISDRAIQGPASYQSAIEAERAKEVRPQGRRFLLRRPRNDRSRSS
jgi:hypothetical protein